MIYDFKARKDVLHATQAKALSESEAHRRREGRYLIAEVVSILAGFAMFTNVSLPCAVVCWLLSLVFWWRARKEDRAWWALYSGAQRALGGLEELALLAGDSRFQKPRSGQARAN